jgi:hypothetical protein
LPLLPHSSWARSGLLHFNFLLLNICPPSESTCHFFPPWSVAMTIIAANLLLKGTRVTGWSDRIEARESGPHLTMVKLWCFKNCLLLLVLAVSSREMFAGSMFTLSGWTCLGIMLLHQVDALSGQWLWVVSWRQIVSREVMRFQQISSSWVLHT